MREIEHGCGKGCALCGANLSGGPGREIRFETGFFEGAAGAVGKVE